MYFHRWITSYWGILSKSIHFSPADCGLDDLMLGNTVLTLVSEIVEFKSASANVRLVLNASKREIVSGSSTLVRVLCL